MNQWTRYGFVALCGVLGAGCLTETRYACPPGSDVTASTRCGLACATGELSADVCVQVEQACTDGRLSAADCAGLVSDMGVADVGVEDVGPPDEGTLDLGPPDLGPCDMPCVGGLMCNVSTGECVRCLDNGDCGGSRPVCDTTAGVCVGCVGHDDCTDDAAPVCVAGDCEECQTNADCPVNEPVCNTTSHTCGPCFSRADCVGKIGTPACNTSTGECTLCDVNNESADCTGLRCLDQTACTQCRPMTVGVDCPTAGASRCAAGTCAPCLDNSSCTHIAGRNRCDAGTCVQCTVATEAMDCGTKSCNPATRTCTTTDRFSRQQCDSCMADSECLQVGGTFRCIPMNYMGTPRGGYCMRAADTGGPSGCTRPFVTPMTASSLSGAASASYCGIDQNAVSCDAVRALQTGRQCPGGSAAECMADGALCETVGFTANLCTYACGIPTHCPPSVSCGSSYCGGS